MSLPQLTKSLVMEVLRRITLTLLIAGVILIVIIWYKGRQGPTREEQIEELTR